MAEEIKEVQRVSYTITGEEPVKLDGEPGEYRSIPCPTCGGRGKLPTLNPKASIMPCMTCQGAGAVDDGFEARAREGSKCRANRIYCGMSVSTFAEKNSLRKSAVCRFEQGIKIGDHKAERIRRAYHNLIP